MRKPRQRVSGRCAAYLLQELAEEKARAAATAKQVTDELAAKQKVPCGFGSCSFLPPSQAVAGAKT